MRRFIGILAAAALVASNEASACSLDAFMGDPLDAKKTSAVFKIETFFMNGKRAEGAAFVIDGKRNLFVTAAHTVLGDLPESDCKAWNWREQARYDEIRVHVPGGYYNLEVAGASVCHDLAVLRPAPGTEKQEALPSLNIAMHSYRDGDRSYANGSRFFSGGGEVKEVYDPWNVNKINLARLEPSDPPWDAVCHGRGGECYRFSIISRSIERGESGSPVVDSLGRVFAVLVRQAEFGQGVAVPTPALWKVIEQLIDGGTRLELAKKLVDEINRADRAAAVNIVLEWPAIDLFLALGEIARAQDAHGLATDKLACPIFPAAETRMVERSIRHKLETHLLAREIAQKENLTRRASLRLVGQRAAEQSRSPNRRLDERMESADQALAAFELALDARLSSVEAPESVVSALYLPAYAGGQPVRNLRVEVSGVQGVSNLSLARGEISTRESEADSISAVATLVGNRFGIDLSGNVAPHQDGVTATLLREYADAAILAFQLAPEGEQEEDLLRLASGAAYWSVRLESDAARLAAAHRTQGDALVRLERHDEAVTAYSRALLTAISIEKNDLVVSLRNRLDETCELAAACTTGGDSVAALYGSARRPISAEIAEFISAGRILGVLP